MKRNFLIIVVTFLSVEISFGQLPTKQWDYRYGGTKSDQLQSLRRTADGGYLLGGKSKSGKNGNKTQSSRGKYDYWIVKTNSAGTAQYDKVFGGSENDELKVILQCTDGGFLLGGYSESPISGDKTQASQGGFDYWIVKTDATGLKLWDKDFGGSDDDKLISMQQTADGGFILAGDSQSGISGDKTQGSQGKNDFWIVKIDATGTKQWDARFGGSGEDRLKSVEQTLDGGYLLAGFSNSDISGDKTQAQIGEDDFWIVKTNKNGVKIWDKTFGGTSTDQLEKAVQTPDGGYLLAGSSNSEISGDKSQSSQGGFDFWILKTDASGLKKWDSRFGGSYDDELSNMIIASDGRYMLAGISNSTISGDKTQESRNASITNRPDFWMVKVDTTGNKLYDLRFGSTSDDECVAIDQATDGGFVLGGYVPTGTTPPDITEYGYGEEDYWIMKTSAGGSGKYITVPTISPVSYFPGDSITIPYEGDGHYSPGNIFTAQLSDTGGNFANSTNLSSINSSSFGNIHTTFPSSIAYSTSYRLRVISSEPSVSSFKNNEDISINNFKAVYKQWDKTYGTVSVYDYAREISETTDGGYIVGGYTFAGINGDKTQPLWGGSDFWIIKMDSNGNKMWDIDLGGTEDEYLYSLQQTNDGGYIFGGSSDSPVSGDKSAPNKGDDDYWIIKTNANGLKQWDKTFGGISGDVLTVVRQTSDGGYVLGGSSSSGGTHGGTDYWIIKTDGNGNKIWDQYYGGTSTDNLNSLMETSDHGFILGGYSNSAAGGSKTQSTFGEEDYWLVKIDEDGNQQWDADFGGPGADAMYSVIQASDGGYLLGGFSESAIGGNKSEANHGGDDYWVVKTDSNGIKQWDHTYGGIFNEAVVCCNPLVPQRSGSICQTSDGNYLIACTSTSGISGDRTQTSRGGDDYWLVKIDSSGSKLWDARFGGDDDDQLFSLKQTSDGGFIVAGTTESPMSGDKSQNNQGQGDFWIVKTDNGFLPASTCVTPNGLSATNIKPTSVNINWNVVANAQSYSIRYRKTGTGPWTKVTASTNSKKLKNLSPNTEYDWIVKSVCDQINDVSSDWCATQNFTTLPLRAGEDEEAITSFEVYPNPFSSYTSISFSLEENADVSMELFDLAERKIKTVMHENVEAGDHHVQLNREQLSSGIYFLKMKVNNQTSTVKILVE